MLPISFVEGERSRFFHWRIYIVRNAALFLIGAGYLNAKKGMTYRSVFGCFS
jgi:hypothetical protein